MKYGFKRKQQQRVYLYLELEFGKRGHVHESNALATGHVLVAHLLEPGRLAERALGVILEEERLNRLVEPQRSLVAQQLAVDGALG